MRNVRDGRWDNQIHFATLPSQGCVGADQGLPVLYIVRGTVATVTAHSEVVTSFHLHPGGTMGNNESRWHHETPLVLQTDRGVSLFSS